MVPREVYGEYINVGTMIKRMLSPSFYEVARPCHHPDVIDVRMPEKSPRCKSLRRMSR